MQNVFSSNIITMRMCSSDYYIAVEMRCNLTSKNNWYNIFTLYEY